MISTLWASPYAVALLSVLCYGLSTPMAKVSMRGYGASPSGLLLAYGICSTVMSLVWNTNGAPISYGSNYRALPFALMTGLLSSTAYLAMNRGVVISSITLMMSFITLAPIISSSIEVSFMGVQLRWQQALFGIVLGVIAVFVVANSRIPVAAVAR